MSRRLPFSRGTTADATDTTLADQVNADGNKGAALLLCLQSFTALRRTRAPPARHRHAARCYNRAARRWRRHATRRPARYAAAATHCLRRQGRRVTANARRRWCLHRHEPRGSGRDTPGGGSRGHLYGELRPLSNFALGEATRLPIRAGGPPPAALPRSRRAASPGSRGATVREARCRRRAGDRAPIVAIPRAAGGPRGSPGRTRCASCKPAVPSCKPVCDSSHDTLRDCVA